MTMQKRVLPESGVVHWHGHVGAFRVGSHAVAEVGDRVAWKRKKGLYLLIPPLTSDVMAEELAVLHEQPVEFGEHHKGGGQQQMGDRPWVWHWPAGA